MNTYLILTTLSPDSGVDVSEFRKLAEQVSETIKRECPGVTWKESYATMGQIDVVDVVESDEPAQVEKAAMIIRSLANATTETLVATPWKEFLDAL